ncbi:hypothetical protein CBR_g44391 [Chara braunii]|uniref:Uncharacterized protein n=1 Tax=Chara braunii TaxID=69332 RepID=A0A388LX91_CHABU|nr:hypothetical protein CBR_g44391 [Chara braunii]|eukprot:GBG86938.1 hypothetical protein CBR_g44391 [Chara braunii]
MAVMHSSSCAHARWGQAHGCGRPLLTYLRLQRLSSAAATNRVCALRSELNIDHRNGCHATSSRRSLLRSHNWNHGICWASLLSQNSATLPCKNFCNLAVEWSSNDGCDTVEGKWINSYPNYRLAARHGCVSPSWRRKVAQTCMPAYSGMEAQPHLGTNVRWVRYIPPSSRVNARGMCRLPAQGLIRLTHQVVRSIPRGFLELLPLREGWSAPKGVIGCSALFRRRQSFGEWGSCTPGCMPGEQIPTGLWRSKARYAGIVPIDLEVRGSNSRDSGRGRGAGNQRRELHACRASRRRSGGTFGDDNEEEEAPKLSKNAMKRVALQGVEWAETLAKMSVKQIESVVEDADLPEEVPEAIALVKTLGIKTKNGRRRQFNYIGSLLRDADPQLMEAAIAAAREGRSLTAARSARQQVENNAESEGVEVARANP